MIANNPSASSLQDELFNVISQELHHEVIKLLDHLDDTSIDDNTSLFEYGLDSIQTQELLANFEKWYGKKISADLLMSCQTINELSRYLSAQLISHNENDTSNHIVPTVANPEQPSEHVSPTRNVKNIKPSHHDFFADYAPFQELKARQAYFGMTDSNSIFFDTHESTAKDTTIINGEKVINFASYNYLGLSGDPIVKKAAIHAIKQYGTSVSASRVVSGQRPLHAMLEAEIASLIGADDCLVFNSGHATNVNVISHLFGPNDLILHDELSHNSLIQGAIFSQAMRLAFKHNNFDSLDRLLKQHHQHHEKILIITEGVFSMDGDIADMPELIRLKKAYNAMLMVDEAHSIGVLGKTGGGIREYFNLSVDEVDIWMGTLSKSFASCGGYIAGKKSLIEYLKYTCPGFVFSVGISPPDTAAALAAIRLMKNEPERVAKLIMLADYARQQAVRYGLDIGYSHHTSIIPIFIGDSKRCIALSLELLKQKINIKPIIYPAVPENQARLRLFITQKHSKKQIKAALIEIVNLLSKK